MSEPVKKVTITDIECRGLRSADLLTKNDVYVIFKVGHKKAKTKYISGGGKNVKFKDVIEMFVSDADLEAGIDFVAYDYDVGPDPDDLLGVGKLTEMTQLKQHANTPRQFDTVLMYKGKNRGSATCVVTLSYPHGGEDKPAAAKQDDQQQLGAVGGQIFNAAMGMNQQPQVVAATPVQPQVVPVVPDPQYMNVTCPANASAGMQVVVQAPDGQRLTVIIPAGVGPGGVFRVPLPAPRQAHVAAVVAAPVQPAPTVYRPPGVGVDVDGDGRPDYYIPTQAPQAPPAYGYQQPPPQYGAPPPQYGAPPPQYGAPPPQYGAPPPQYGAPPPQYGGGPPPRYY